ncbi:MAG: hypothetical protein DMG74_06735 [Acidobacteria bacterium]|nr:MAG: hypothetical protein DMG74_06735 [Acidobacteriota bacterium]
MHDEACRSRGGCDILREAAFYRVNFEVSNLKPFPYLAFPHSIHLKTARKRPSFDGKVMASFQPPDSQ